MAHRVLLAAAALAAGAAAACDDSAVACVFSGCENGTRSQACHWADAACASEPLPLPVFSDVSCECTQYDYEPVYGDCLDGERPIDYAVATDCTDGVTPAPTTGLCACTPADFLPIYTTCQNGKRSLVYVLRPGTECLGKEPPAATYDLPCGFSCPVGEYLPLGASECTACEAGHAGIGSSRQWGGHSGWAHFDDFSTHCTYTASIEEHICSPWSLNGTFIESGRNLDFDNLNSELELDVVLVQDGFVRFTYMVQAEPYWDGLSFYIDGVLVMGRQSSQHYFTTVEYDMDAGLHTLRWVYHKDWRYTYAPDVAQIRDVFIFGLQSDLAECYPCDPGHASAGGAEFCEPCAANTIAPGLGQAECDPCADNEFAYVGSTLCLPRQPCTDSDYESYFTECSDGTRSQEFRWIAPHVCDPSALELPPSVTGLPCAPCNPGQYRPADQSDCIHCPSGSFRDDDMQECEPCLAGTAAVPSIYFSNFFENQLPVELSTYCSPVENCVSEGWLQHGDYIDSGIIHDPAKSTLSLEVVIDEQADGYVEFEYSINCQSVEICYLQFVVDGIKHGDIQNEVLAGNNVYRYPLPAGTHLLEWEFNMLVVNDQVAAGDAAGDQVTIYTARLHSIKVAGTETGGAGECVDCPTGYYTAPESRACLVCDAGHTSNQLHSACVPCPAGFFAPTPGSACKSCGRGTTSGEAATECAHDCTYSPDGSDWQYDLSSLSSALSAGTSGPIRDMASGFKYFLSPCARPSDEDTSCVGPDGEPIRTHACQVISSTLGFDAGQFVSFYDHPSDPSMGMMASYFGGTMCDVGARQTNVTYTCNPDAGLGEPVAGLRGFEPEVCQYEFEWETLYACRECSASDYGYIYTDCSNGRRTKIYVWHEEPRTCHGGVSLPEPESVACAPPTPCAAGEFLSMESGEGECQACPAGRYSTGGNLVVDHWTAGVLESDTGMTTTCNEEDQCQGWQADSSGQFVSAGAGLESTLSLTVNLQDANRASVQFSYKLFTHTDDDYLLFTVDGVEQGRYSSPVFDRFQVTPSYKIPVGTHVLAWTFKRSRADFNANTGYSYSGASLAKVTVSGTGYAASTCTACPPGRFSDVPKSTHCRLCPSDTFSARSGRTSCSPCERGTFAFPGSSSCARSPECTEEDMVEYRVADESVVNVVAGWLDPKICYEGASLPEPRTEPEPDSCPPGLVLLDGTCKACPLGTARPAGESECSECLAGQAAILRSDFHFDEPLAAESRISTGCSGSCGSSGWRALGSGLVDSGNHPGSHDSFIHFRVQLTDPGEVEFNAVLTDSDLQFLIDDEPMLSITGQQDYRARFELTTGEHILTMNQHGSSGVGVVISNMTVTSTAEGVAESCATCPPGFFTSDPGATSCTPCDPGTATPRFGSMSCTDCTFGTFADSPGMAQCIACGSGTYGNTDTAATECLTECRFEPQEGLLYDLGPLMGMVYGPIIDQADRRFESYLTVCAEPPPPVENPCGDASSCQLWYDGSYVNTGDVLRFEEHHDGPERGVVVKYTHGDSSACVSGTRETHILFECDLDAGKGTPNVMRSVIEDPCIHEFYWPSAHACRVCDESDFVLHEGRCDAGYSIAGYTKASVCYGSPPPDITEKCSSYSVPAGAIIGTLVAFAVLIAIVGFVWYRNRKLSDRYSLLVSRHGTEMGNIGSEDEDGDIRII